MTKEEFSRDYLEIYEGYNLKLIDCHNFCIGNITNPMPYFINYLRFMRDYYLITTPKTDQTEETNVKVSSLMTAIKIYEKYTSNKELLKNPNLSEEEAKKVHDDSQYLSERFWQLVAINMEDWLPYDA